VAPTVTGVSTVHALSDRTQWRGLLHRGTSLVVAAPGLAGEMAVAGRAPGAAYTIVTHADSRDGGALTEKRTAVSACHRPSPDRPEPDGLGHCQRPVRRSKANFGSYRRGAAISGCRVLQAAAVGSATCG